MEEELTLRDLVEILKRKRGWIFGIFLAITLLGALYAFVLAKPKYESYAILGVNPLEIKAQLENKIELRPANILTPETLNALLVSQEVLVETAKNVQNAKDLPQDWRDLPPEELAALLQDQMQVRITTKKVEKGMVLTAKLQSTATSPELAAQIANAWAQTSVATLDKLTTGQLKANLEAISRQLPDAEAAFRQAQKDWEAFQRTNLLSAWETELSQIETRLAAISKRLGEIPTELAKVEAELEVVKKQLPQTPLRYTLTQSIVEDPLAANLAASQGLEALKGLKLVSQQLNPNRLYLEQRLLELEETQQRLNRELTALEDEQTRQIQRAEELRKLIAAAKLKEDHLNETLKLTKETYLALKQKQTDLKIELASLQGSFAQILSPAYPNPEPVAPKKGLILVLSAILGLMLGVFVAFISAALEAPSKPETASQEA